jgi:glycosyltransferase involved in cell wall biosynthesis
MTIVHDRTKILIAVTDAHSLNTLCKGQLEYLRDKGRLELTYACGGTNEELVQLKKRNVGDIYWIPTLKRRPQAFADLWSIAHLLVILMRVRPQVIVFSTPKMMLLGSVASKLLGVKRRIALVRGRVWENMSGCRRLFYKSCDKMALRFSSEVLYISNSLRTGYAATGIDPEFSIVLGAGSSNGVNIEYFRPPDELEKASAREKLSITEDAFIVLIIGRLCEDKGAYDLLEVMQKVREAVHFIWVGKVEDENALQKLRTTTFEQARFAHYPHSDDIRGLLWASNLHLMLSHREGFGNVAIEAAACSVPTLAYSVTGVVDSVSEKISGWKLPLGMISSIAEKIDTLNKDRQKLRQCSATSRGWAAERFEQQQVWLTWENYLLQGFESPTQAVKSKDTSQ